MEKSLWNAQMSHVPNRNMCGIVICHCFCETKCANCWMSIQRKPKYHPGNLSKTNINLKEACFGFTENHLQKAIAIKNMVIFWLSQEPVQLFRPS